jgi:hypothetical protein
VRYPTSMQHSLSEASAAAAAAAAGAPAPGMSWGGGEWAGGAEAAVFATTHPGAGPPGEGGVKVDESQVRVMPSLAVWLGPPGRDCRDFFRRRSSMQVLALRGRLGSARTQTQTKRAHVHHFPSYFFEHAHARFDTDRGS